MIKNFFLISKTVIYVFLNPVLRIRDVYCGSGMFIPDPNFSNPDPGSRVKKISDPGSGSTSQNLIIFKILLFPGTGTGNEVREKIPVPTSGTVPELKLT
jgi:hypothetical protein